MSAQPAPQQERYWIITAPRSEVRTLVFASIAQPLHGTLSAQKRMSPGDWVIYYSARHEPHGNAMCQCFTAIGRVMEAAILGDLGITGQQAFSRSVEYRECQEVPVHPLVPELNFITNKRNWGAIFHFGFFEIQRPDFLRIARAMLGEKAFETM